jgi:hypothetical protein
MPYTLDPLDDSQPLQADQGLVLGGEVREIKKYIGKMPVNSQAANYTIVPADQGKIIRHPHNDANVRTYNFQANATLPWKNGGVVTVENRHAGVNLLVTTSDPCYLAGYGSTGARTVGPKSVGTWIWDSVEGAWQVAGTGVS